MENIQDICLLASEIAKLPITAIENDEILNEFCSKYRFHAIQTYLNPNSLKDLLNKLDSLSIFTLEDPLKINFLFCKAGDMPIILGPYITDLHSANFLRDYLSSLDISTSATGSFMAYRSQFHKYRQDEALYTLQCLLKYLNKTVLPYQIISLDSPPAEYAENAYPLPANTAYSKIIENRYRTELNMMDEIKKGSFHTAIKYLHQLRRDTDFLKSLGNQLENARTSQAITRTTIRLSAMEAGLPAYVIDSLSDKSAAKVRSAKNIEKMNEATEMLIKEYCQLITERQSKNLSDLTLSVLYCFKQQFRMDIKINQMAFDLNVSADRLTKTFKKETGKTPVAYLNELRMNEAGKMLLNSDASIASIASDVGIPDAGYFTKSFKKQFGCTPKEYRKNRIP